MTNDEVMQRINDQAKAEGRYLGKAFWEIPRQPGSILDVPSTPESERRLASLRERRMKITKPGRIIDDHLVGTCRKCKCEVECKKAEATWMEDRVGESNACFAIVCPTCAGWIYLRQVRLVEYNEEQSAYLRKRLAGEI